jgi:hypothetical protein
VKQATARFPLDRRRGSTVPPAPQFQPPRLSEVGDATLYINRRLEFRKQAPDPQPAEKTVEAGTVLAHPEPRAPLAADPQTLKMLRSLKRAAWFVVVLLALILIRTVFRQGRFWNDRCHVRSKRIRRVLDLLDYCLP